MDHSSSHLHSWASTQSTSVLFCSNSFQTYAYQSSWGRSLPWHPSAQPRCHVQVLVTALQGLGLTVLSVPWAPCQSRGREEGPPLPERRALPLLRSCHSGGNRLREGTRTAPGHPTRRRWRRWLADLTGSVYRLPARGLLAETTLSLFPAAPPAAISWKSVRGDSHRAHRPPRVALGRREELGPSSSLSRNQIGNG